MLSDNAQTIHVKLWNEKVNAQLIVCDRVEVTSLITQEYFGRKSVSSTSETETTVFCFLLYLIPNGQTTNGTCTFFIGDH